MKIELKVRKRCKSGVFLKFLTIFIVFIFLGNIVCSQISLDEAVDIASSYAGDKEIATAPLDISHNNNLYYVVDFYRGTSCTGLIVIDGLSGDIVLDEKKAKDILFTRYLYENCSVEELQSFLKISKAFEVYAEQFRQQAEKDLSLSETVGPNLTKDFKDLSDAEQFLSKDFSELSTLFENISIIEKNILQKPSHELADDFFYKCDEIVNQLGVIADDLLDVRLILIVIRERVKDPENKQNVEKYLDYVETTENSTLVKAEKLEEEFTARKSVVEEKVESALTYVEMMRKAEREMPMPLVIIIPISIVGVVAALGSAYYAMERKKYRYTKKWKKW